MSADLNELEKRMHGAMDALKKEFGGLRTGRASVNLLDPAGDPTGVSHKMIIDATTPIAPDVRGDYGEELDQPLSTEAWAQKLDALIKGMAK